MPLLAYLPEWTLAMRSAQRSPRTVASYTAGVRSRPELWLGDRNRGPVSDEALAAMLVRRAQQAGLRLHPHQLRHFFADAWLREGGSEGGLMRAAAWSSRQMLDRYASANAAERSRAERRRLTLGDTV